MNADCRRRAPAALWIERREAPVASRPVSCATRSGRRRGPGCGLLAAAMAALMLQGCVVTTVAGAAVGAAVSVTGAVVSTSVKVAGKVVEKTVDVVTPAKD